MMTELEKYYNKFNEEKRLKSRHGQVEFITSMKYIHKYLPKREHGQVKILDVGAGTGRYSVALAEEGYDVTAVELVKYNLGILKKKNSSVKAYQGNALKLSRFPDKEFDLIILFGPMYHLYTKEDKVKALMEAKRVLKDEGTILVAYTMNEYSVLVYGFRENHIQECLEHAYPDSKNPELPLVMQKNRKNCHSKVCHDTYCDQLFCRIFLRKSSENNRKWESYDLRKQQCKKKSCTAKSKC